MAFYVTQPEAVGELKRIWLGSIYAKPDNRGVMQTNALFEIDCKQNRARFLQVDSYGRNGDPLAIKLMESPDKWYYPNPDVVAYRVIHMGCGKEPIVGEGFDSLKDALKSKAAPTGAKPAA